VRLFCCRVRDEVGILVLASYLALWIWHLGSGVAYMNILLLASCNWASFYWHPVTGCLNMRKDQKWKTTRTSRLSRHEQSPPATADQIPYECLTLVPFTRPGQHRVTTCQFSLTRANPSQPGSNVVHLNRDRGDLVPCQATGRTLYSKRR